MTCLLCGHEGGEVIMSEPFKLGRCSRCGFIKAVEHDPAASHKDDYYSEVLPPPKQAIPGFIKHRVAGIKRFLKKGRALDLGCGMGELVVALDGEGFECCGVDNSYNAINHLKEKHPKINWTCKGINTFLRNATAKNFDLITLYHILEHVPDPKELCHLAKNALSAGGVMAVEVPDAGCLQFRLFPEKWPYTLEHHINYFTFSTIRRLMEGEGFKLLGCEKKYCLTYPEGVFWRDMLRRLLSRAGMNNVLTTYWGK